MFWLSYILFCRAFFFLGGGEYNSILLHFYKLQEHVFFFYFKLSLDVRPLKNLSDSQVFQLDIFSIWV